MLHPLVNNLHNLTDPQLEEKIHELQRKYFQTYNLDVQLQISTILDIFREELNTRRAIATQKLREQTDSSGKDLDSLIKVN